MNLNLAALTASKEVRQFASVYTLTDENILSYPLRRREYNLLLNTRDVAILLPKSIKVSENQLILIWCYDDVPNLDFQPFIMCKLFYNPAHNGMCKDIFYNGFDFKIILNCQTMLFHHTQVPDSSLLLSF